MIRFITGILALVSMLGGALLYFFSTGGQRGDGRHVDPNRRFARRYLAGVSSTQRTPGTASDHSDRLGVDLRRLWQPSGQKSATCC